MKEVVLVSEEEELDLMQEEVVVIEFCRMMEVVVVEMGVVGP